MSVVRPLRNWLSWFIRAVVAVGPIGLLGAASVLDRGPEGGVRASTFWVAVAALDPFVWTCLRNSLATAGAVAAGSMLLGLYVGRLIGDWRFPARSVLVAAAAVSAVAPPAVTALGVSILFGSAGDWSIDWTRRLGSAGRYVPGDWRWYAWFWSALVQGGSIAVLSCASTLQGFDPAWRDAARLVGGGRGRVWRKLGWPLLRPPLTRAAGLAFMLTLAEPGAPLVLGLRRTLGYQIVAVGLSADPFPRAAVLGLIAVLVCVVVRAGLNGWAGAGPSLARPASRPRREGSRRRAAVGALAAGVWVGLAGAPILALLLEAVRGRTTGGGRALWESLLDPAIGAVLWRSAWLGVAASALLAVVGRFARALSTSSASSASGRLSVLLITGTAPPLALGVAVLSLPYLCGLAVEAIDGASPSGLVVLVRRAAAVVGSDEFGELLPAVAVALATAPAFFAIWKDALGPDLARGDRLAAAVLAGAGRSRARRLADAWRRWDALRRYAAVACLAASNVAPAVLLAHRPDDQTLGPAILLFREDPGFGLGAASALAVGAAAVNVAAVVLASSTRIAARPGG